jgi:hypothetical protein
VGCLFVGSFWIPLRPSISICIETPLPWTGLDLYIVDKRTASKNKRKQEIQNPEIENEWK